MKNTVKRLVSEYWRISGVWQPNVWGYVVAAFAVLWIKSLAKTPAYF